MKLFTDQLAISAMANDSLVRKGGTAQFTATVGGVGKLTYQWWKRGVDILPGKVLGQNTTVLIIPNMEESDEGQYYCNVTNEWGKRLTSNNVTLRFYGTYVGISDVCVISCKLKVCSTMSVSIMLVYICNISSYVYFVKTCKPLVSIV